MAEVSISVLESFSQTEARHGRLIIAQRKAFAALGSSLGPSNKNDALSKQWAWMTVSMNPASVDLQGGVQSQTRGRLALAHMSRRCGSPNGPSGGTYLMLIKLALLPKASAVMRTENGLAS